MNSQRIRSYAPGIACVILVALTASCADQRSLSPADRPPEPDIIDYAVINAVLKDCITNKEFGLPADSQAKKVALCSWTPERFSDDVAVSTLGEDAQKKLRTRLSPGFIEALKKRNKTAHNLQGFSTTDENLVTINEPSRSPEGYSWLAMPSDCRGYVAPFLPAYSSDMTTAVLVFCAGPSEHGMTGVYLLTCTNGTWTVRQRQINQYL